MNVEWKQLEKKIPDWMIDGTEEDIDYPSISDLTWNNIIEGVDGLFPVGLMLLTDEPEGDKLGNVLIIGSTNRNGGRCGCCCKYEKIRAYSFSLIELLKDIGFEEK